MTKEYLDCQINALELGEDLRDHLLYLLERELGDQVQEILNAFANADKPVACEVVEANASSAWANAAAVRILAQMELPTLGKLRQYLAHFIQREVEQLVRNMATSSTSADL